MMILVMMTFGIYCQVGSYSYAALTLLGWFKLCVSRVVTPVLFCGSSFTRRDKPLACLSRPVVHPTVTNVLTRRIPGVSFQLLEEGLYKPPSFIFTFHLSLFWTFFKPFKFSGENFFFPQIFSYFPILFKLLTELTQIFYLLPSNILCTDSDGF